MPIFNDRITLGTAPTLIVGDDNMPQEVHLHNMTKSSNEYIYVGDSNVGTANAIHIDPGADLTLTLRPGDRLYAVSDPSGLDVGILTIQKAD